MITGFSALLSSLLLGFSGTWLINLSMAQAADLETILARGKLVVAVKDNTPPLGFVDPSGQRQGLEIEIAHRLAAELLGNANAIEFRAVTNQERLDLLLHDQVDLVIARMTVNGFRSRLVDFSPPYYLDGTGLLVKQGRSLGDLTHQKIAVLNGSDTIAVLRSELPHCQLVGVASYQAAFQLLEGDEVAGVAADNSILTGWMQDHPQYHRLPVRWSGAALAVVMPKGLQYGTLRDRVNTAIANWRQSGWLRERSQAWGLPWFDDKP